MIQVQGIQHDQVLHCANGAKVRMVTPTVFNFETGLIMVRLETTHDGRRFELMTKSADGVLTPGLDHEGNAHYLEAK